MIVVEGADNCGKSRLVNVLSSKLSLNAWKSPGPVGRDRMVSYMGQAVSAWDVVSDRYPAVSEPIYGSIVRAAPKITRDESWPYLHHLRSDHRVPAPRVYHKVSGGSFSMRPGLLIYCRPPRSTALDFSTHEPKPGETVEHLESVYQLRSRLLDEYDETMALLVLWGATVLWYNWTEDPDASKLLSVLTRA